jgi:hypothetical protein
MSPKEMWLSRHRQGQAESTTCRNAKDARPNLCCPPSCLSPRSSIAERAACISIFFSIVWLGGRFPLSQAVLYSTVSPACPVRVFICDVSTHRLICAFFIIISRCKSCFPKNQEAGINISLGYPSSAPPALGNGHSPLSRWHGRTLNGSKCWIDFHLLPFLIASP